MSGDLDGRVPEQCVTCGKPTTSHPVPFGYVCHSCLKEVDDETILDAVKTEGVVEGGPDTTLECEACGIEYTPREAHTPGSNHVAILGGGMTTVAGYDTVLIASCPRCTLATEFYIDEASERSIQDGLGLDVRSKLSAGGRSA